MSHPAAARLEQDLLAEGRVLAAQAATAAAVPAAKIASDTAKKVGSAAKRAAGPARRVAENERERKKARLQAWRFAEQTDGMMALVQFPDGPERWTVYKADRPIGAFPPYDGDLTAALAYHQPNRLGLVSPKELGKKIVSVRVRQAGSKAKARMRGPRRSST